MQRKGGNCHISACRVADAEHSILTPVLADKLKARARKFILAKGVVAAKHLISAVKDIHRLLTPRAVLVMLVHTESQRSLAYLVDCVKLIVLAVKGKCSKRIIARNYLYFNILKRTLTSKLSISQTKSAEISEIIVQPTLCIIIKRKVARVYPVAHPTVSYMLAVAKLNMLLYLRIEPDAVNANNLTAKIKKIPVSAAALALYKSAAYSLSSYKSLDRSLDARHKFIGSNNKRGCKILTAANAPIMKMILSGRVV